MRTSKRIKLTKPRGKQTRAPQKSRRAEPAIVSLPQLNTQVMPEPESVEPTRAELDAEPPHDAHDHSAFRLYLQEIGQTKLLTPEEEVQLAKRIQKGDKKAREQMIKANLRLVVKIARGYEGYGVPLLDLISEGNIGLMKAVERYDPRKGAKLSTYSAWWIKQSIRRALSNLSKTIRLPVHVVDKLAQMRRAEAKFFDEFGREPNDDELADELNIDTRRIGQYRRAAYTPSSLDAPIGDEDSSQISDIVADERAETPYEQLEDETNTRLVRQMVQTLSPREKSILQLRFGLDDTDEQTLEEVGQKFNLTRERIRQIQESALRKLRKKMTELDSCKKLAMAG